MGQAHIAPGGGWEHIDNCIGFTPSAGAVLLALGSANLRIPSIPAHPNPTPLNTLFPVEAVHLLADPPLTLDADGNFEVKIKCHCAPTIGFALSVVEGEMVVASVLQSSEAMRIGIRVDDVLLHVWKILRRSWDTLSKFQARRQVRNETVASPSVDDYLSAVAEQKLKEAEKKKSQLISLAMDWRKDKPESQERQCHLLREALNLLKEAKEAQKVYNDRVSFMVYFCGMNVLPLVGLLL